ncbi:MAG: hypothetical protein ABSH51_01760 [Solirubrobacteraceae bacterium]|jgi:hypothetical protein
MSDQRQPGVLGSLPRTRPHRRSDKRATPASRPPPPASRPAADPPPVVPAREPPEPEPAAYPGPLETAVQAAAELAEIGLHASARALRGALARLPRP